MYQRHVLSEKPELYARTVINQSLSPIRANGFEFFHFILFYFFARLYGYHRDNRLEMWWTSPFMRISKLRFIFHETELKTLSDPLVSLLATRNWTPFPTCFSSSDFSQSFTHSVRLILSPFIFFFRGARYYFGSWFMRGGEGGKPTNSGWKCK